MIDSLSHAVTLKRLAISLSFLSLSFGPSLSFCMGEPVATVNGSPVTDDDVRITAARNGHNLYDTDAAVDALEDTVTQELLAAEAKALGYFDDPEIQRLVKKMAVQKLVKDKIDGELERIINTDEELRGYYDAHPEEFSKPSVAKAQILWFEDGADVAAVTQQAQAGAKPFAELVKEHSRDVAAKVNGGMSNWMIEGGDNKRYLPEVVEAVFSLSQSGELAGPLNTTRGTFLIKLAEMRRGMVTPYEDAKRNISRMIYRRKRQEAYNTYCEQLKQRYPVEINEEAFEKMIVPIKPNSGPPLGPVRVKPAN